MDNMRVHHSHISKESYRELELTPIFNIAYSPQFNPIESVFSMIKSNYKKLLLKCLIEKHKVRTRQMIANAISALEIEKIRNCIRHGIDELKS